MNDVTIRPMQLRDAAAVAELEKQCFSMPWSERSVASELDNPLSLWLVAEQAGCLIGYIGSQTVLDEADMMNLCVAPDARRRGLGRALVGALTSALAQRGVQTLTLEVRASNEAAQALYAQLGFRLVGRRKDYYRLPREDALILKRELKEA